MHFISHNISKNYVSNSIVNDRTFEITSMVYDIPAEAIAFAIAAFVARIFGSVFAAPLIGISIGLLTSRLVVKILERYNGPALIKLTKQVCILNIEMPRLQMISFISALVTSLFFQTIGLIIGFGLGGYSAIVLNVENYKLTQQANRHKLR